MSYYYVLVIVIMIVNLSVCLWKRISLLLFFALIIHRELISPSFAVRTFASDGSEVIQEVICWEIVLKVLISSVITNMPQASLLHCQVKRDYFSNTN